MFALVGRTVNLSLAAAVCVSLICASATAGVISPELGNILEKAGPGEKVPVIVRFFRAVDHDSFKEPGGRRKPDLIKALKAGAERSQGRARSILDDIGAEDTIVLWAINGIAARVPAGSVDSLAALPGVESVRFDYTVEQPPVSFAAPSSPGWNLDMVRAPEAWSLGHTGAGAVVATMDTGVDPDHPDISGKSAAGVYWYDPNGEHAAPYDGTGHGTQVMGLILGQDAGGTAIGVAPDAAWMAVKIFSDRGTARLSVIHSGFQWLLDPDGDPLTDDAPDVVNNSWGYSLMVNECYNEFELDIALLRAAGTAVVFSAGNEGPASFTSISPANNPGAFAAGSVDEFYEAAPSSGRGPSACGGGIFPAAAAPGVNVKTADLTFGGQFPDSYIFVSGTSFSAAHVTGAAAILMGAYPDAPLESVEEALRESSLDLGDLGPDDTYGWGLIDLVEAVRFLDGYTPPACTDSDGDGFFAEEGCGTPADCNDYSYPIHPGACDTIRDGVDQDCDGVDRERGYRCPREGKGRLKARACSDGLDNDGDGLVDCGDPGCSRSKSCRDPRDKI